MEIRLIGRPRIHGDDGDERLVRGHQSWALLARIVLSDRPLGRRVLSAELFPSADDPLGALRWCLAGLRRAIGTRSALIGDPVAPNLPDSTMIDAVELEHGRFDGDPTGTLLQDVDPRSSPELETWLMVQRQRVAGLLDAHVRVDVLQSLSAGDTSRAVHLATLGVQRAALDERTHVLLVKSLVAAGSHAAATAHVEQTETLFRSELGVDPTPALRNAARARLSGAPPGVSRRAVATSLLDSGRAALDAGATDAGVECLRRAADDADLAGDRHLLAICLFELGTALVHAVRSHDDEGATLLQRSADLAEGLGDGTIAAQAARELGYIDVLAGRRPSAQVHLDRGRALAGDDVGLLAGIDAVDGLNLGDWGRHDEAIARYSTAVERARHIDNPRWEAWALGLGSWTRLDAGDVGGARSWISECLEVTAANRWISFRPFPVAVAAEAALRGGGIPAALRHDLDESFALSCNLADPCWEGATARTIALTHAASGDLPSALEWIDSARDRCLRETDVYVGMHAAILATDAELAAAAGDGARAQVSARALVALSARGHMDAYLQRGLTLMAAS